MLVKVVHIHSLLSPKTSLDHISFFHKRMKKGKQKLRIGDALLDVDVLDIPELMDVYSTKRSNGKNKIKK